MMMMMMMMKSDTYVKLYVTTQACRCDVILRRLRVPTVAVEKQ